MVKKILFFILTLIYFANGIYSNGPCDDGWEPYKDEKCLKIFDGPGLLGYADAENYCKDQIESYLVTVDTDEKQKFFEEFLKSHSVFVNVWIGLRYVDNKYQWADGTQSQYTNWASGSPKNDTNYCVQIHAETDFFGLWSEEICQKKNLVICEKIQLWSLTLLQTTVMNMLKNPLIPVGFIYVQLPKEKSPGETWPWMEWEDISSEYAGLFFRTEGGNAAAFGEVQNADSPKLVSMMIAESESDIPNEIEVLANNEYSEILDIDRRVDEDTNRGFQVKVSNGEVRPINVAIKIWKRIK